MGAAAFASDFTATPTQSATVKRAIQNFPPHCNTRYVIDKYNSVQQNLALYTHTK
jgi:hypothetical protein